MALDQPAQATFVGELLLEAHVRRPAPRMVHHVGNARGFGSDARFAGLIDGHRELLFGEHLQAGIERGDRRVAVRVAGPGDDDGVQIAAGGAR